MKDTEEDEFHDMLEEEEEKELYQTNPEDLDMDTPVDPMAFESLKVTRNKFKKKITEWIANFKRVHQRDPN